MIDLQWWRNFTFHSQTKNEFLKVKAKPTRIPGRGVVYEDGVILVLYALPVEDLHNGVRVPNRLPNMLRVHYFSSF